MMKIEILGSGCAKCKSLAALEERVVKETGATAEIVKVDDIAEIVKRGVLSTQVLAINGHVKSVGTLPAAEQIEAWIKRA